MRLLERNKRVIYYSHYLGEFPVVDENGYETGEHEKRYTKPKELKCSVSPAKGVVATTPGVATDIFGDIAYYNRVVMVGDPNFEVYESTVFFVDVKPEDNAIMSWSNNAYIRDDGIVVIPTDSHPYINDLTGYDYKTMRIAHSLTNTSILIKKVSPLGDS